MEARDNGLLEQYIGELDAVKLCAGLLTVVRVSQLGNAFPQTNRQDCSLHEGEPSECAAAVGPFLNLIHLLASLVAPYMLDPTKTISTQLRKTLSRSQTTGALTL